MSDVSFLPAALREFEDAAEYYDIESPGLGMEFADELREAVERIASFPEHGNPYLAGTRRVLLSRFPYALVYRIGPNGIVVVAVAHHRRRPGYWRRRL